MRINIKLSVQWVLKVTLSSCEMQKERDCEKKSVNKILL